MLDWAGADSLRPDLRQPREAGEALRQEVPGRRDISHVLSRAPCGAVAGPQELFIDLSHTYRLWQRTPTAGGFRTDSSVARLRAREDAEAMNRMYAGQDMARCPSSQFIWDNHRTSPVLTYLVAVVRRRGYVIGSVTGVDHARAVLGPRRGLDRYGPRWSTPGVELSRRR